MSVLVIGAGITGAGIAHELHQGSNCDVKVLESGNEACSGATGSSWAWINANQKTPKWYQTLNIEGMHAWRRREPYKQYFESSGAVVFKDEAARAAQALTDPSATAPPYASTSLSRSELAKVEPEVILDQIESSARHFPSEGYADPYNVTRALLEPLEAAGKVLYNTPVRALRKDGTDWVVVTTRGDEYRAAVVVIACGIRSASLVAKEPISYHLPLQWAPGVLAHTEPIPSRVLQGVVVGTRVHAIQRRSGEVVIGDGASIAHGGEAAGTATRDWGSSEAGSTREWWTDVATLTTATQGTQGEEQQRLWEHGEASSCCLDTLDTYSLTTYQPFPPN